MLSEVYHSGVLRGRPIGLFKMPENQMAHDEAIRMVLFKIARIATAQTHHADNYDDLIGYAQIAKNIAIGETNETTKG